MAKNTAAATANGDAPPKKRGKLGVFMIMSVAVVSAPFIMPTLILFLLGMIPTIVALFCDNDRQKSSTAAIGAMNFAGVVPFIIDLWMKGQTMQNVWTIAGQLPNWVIMFGAAAIGQLIVFTVPQAMAFLTLARYEARLKVLKENLESLKSSWGPEVGTTKPVDKIGF